MRWRSSLLVVIVLGAALGAILPRLSAGAAALLGFTLIVAIFVGGWLAYTQLHLLLDPSYPALAIGLLVALGDPLRLSAGRAAARRRCASPSRTTCRRRWSTS